MKPWRDPDPERALNRAADEITALAPGDDRLRDALNLMVNATLHYLAHPNASLEDAVRAHYDDELAEVIGWIRG